MPIRYTPIRVFCQIRSMSSPQATYGREWEVSLKKRSCSCAFGFRGGTGRCGFGGAEFAGGGAAKQNGVPRKNCAQRPIDRDLKLLFQVDEFVEMDCVPGCRIVAKRIADHFRG